MVEPRHSVMQISTADLGGGAERIAYSLHHAYQSLGVTSSIAVGSKRGKDPDIFVIPNDECSSLWSRSCLSIASQLTPFAGKIKGADYVRRQLRKAADLRSVLDIIEGKESFNYPGTRQLLNISQNKPDLLHGHNLHGSYFDLTLLPWLSRQVPFVLTLHDAWMLSGHCVHSFDCDRWKTGCGQCPDLSIPLTVQKDATDFNWQRKSGLYSESRLYVATPCQWLMDKVKVSMLWSGVIDARVIPNGVDLTVFHSTDKRAVRALLGIPPEAKVILFTANSIRGNPFKDFKMMHASVEKVAAGIRDQELIFIALGESGPAEQIGGATIRFIPYEINPVVVARYYQAADLYIHASRADTFPNTILEALACGVPVVATSTCGIPEQIISLEMMGSTSGRNSSEATGILVPTGDSKAMADGISLLLNDEALRLKLAANAAADAARRFDLKLQVRAYLEWYQQIVCPIKTRK